MPSGDRQRTWFPEMIEILRDQWTDSLSWEELFSIRDRLDTTLQRIRNERNIQPTMTYCRRCRKRYPSAPPRVSVRAMIISIGRFGNASEEEAITLEKRWKKFRKENNLDLYGKKVITNGCTSPPTIRINPTKVKNVLKV